MKQKLLSILAVMLMALTANAQHEYVDLGLPSGTLWATTNVGGTAPESCGPIYGGMSPENRCVYVSWGETYSSEYYDPYYTYYDFYEDDPNTSFTTFTKYVTKSEYGYKGFVDNLTELLPEDDAATVAWGSEWQTPSVEQLDELIDENYTTSVWTTLNGVNGMRITSKSNGNSIFLPAGGYGYGFYFHYDDEIVIHDVGNVGCYWSRTLYTENNSAAYNLTFYSSNISTGCEARYCGHNIRAVRVKEPEPDPNQVYTEFVESTGTLTYYYDTKREERTGITELYNPIKYPDAVRFKDYNKKVTKVAIDPSMKQATLTSFRNMSYGGYDSETWTSYTLPNVTSIEGLENLNTEIVTDMNSMFIMYPLVTSIDVSSFNTSKVTNMNGMFLGCNKLQRLDLTSFDVSNVKDMRMMFGSCYELTTIYCNDDWSQIVPPNNEMENMDNMYVMFSGCKKLVGGQGTVFDSNVINGTYARPDGGEEAPGYFTERKYVVSDVNCDGTADTQDVLMIYEYMKTVGSEANGAREDVNGDGSVDTQDILMIYEYIRNH